MSSETINAQAVDRVPEHEKWSVLIVDDEYFVRESFRLYFESCGFAAHTASSGEEGLARFGELSGDLDVVLLDLSMPGMGGMAALLRMKAMDPSIEVVIATGCGSVRSAVEAVQAGAYDYVTKPILNLEDDLLTVVRNALDHRQSRRLKQRRVDEAIVTSDRSYEPMYLIYRSIDRALGNELAAGPSSQQLSEMLKATVNGFIDATGCDGGFIFIRSGAGVFRLIARMGSFKAIGDGLSESTMDLRVTEILGLPRDRWGRIGSAGSAEDRGAADQLRKTLGLWTNVVIPTAENCGFREVGIGVVRSSTDDLNEVIPGLRTLACVVLGLVMGSTGRALYE